MKEKLIDFLLYMGFNYWWYSESPIQDGTVRVSYWSGEKQVYKYEGAISGWSDTGEWETID